MWTFYVAARLFLSMVTGFQEQEYPKRKSKAEDIYLPDISSESHRITFSTGQHSYKDLSPFKRG